MIREVIPNKTAANQSEIVYQ